MNQLVNPGQSFTKSTCEASFASQLGQAFLLCPFFPFNKKIKYLGKCKVQGNQYGCTVSPDIIDKILLIDKYLNEGKPL